MSHPNNFSIFCLTVSIGIFSWTPAHAQSAAQPNEVSAVYACKSVTDSLKRLECYDNAVGRLQKAEESGEVVTVSKAEVEKVERDAFGFNIPSLPGLGKLFKKDKNKPAKSAALTTKGPKSVKNKEDSLLAKDMKTVSFEISKTTTFGRDKIRFFLDNGQVWEQVTQESIRIPKVRNGVLNTAEIRKASLGSFLMRINGKGRATRVRRVR